MIAFTQGDGPALLDRIEEVTDLYLQIRGEQDHASSDLYSRDTFLERTTRQANSDGFGIVFADAPGELVGFAFGVPFAPGGWWSGNPTMPPTEILDVAKFAVIELDVATSQRGNGYGRRLIDELLAGRTEPYAILTSVPGTPARGMYERWGWQQIGTAQHSADSPVMDQLVLPLPA